MKHKNYIKNNVYYLYTFTIDSLIDIFKNMLKEDSFYHTIYIFGLENFANHEKLINNLLKQEEIVFQNKEISDNRQEIIYSYYKYQVIFSRYTLAEKRFFELHKHITDELISFCEKEGIHNAEEIHFTIDNLKPSLLFSGWHPSSDSCLTIYGKDKEVIIESV